MAVSSLQAFAVFVLYVRCTAIDPADPGVIDYQHSRKHNEKDPSESSLGIVPGPLDIGLSLHPSDPSSVAPSVKGAENKEALTEEGQLQRQRPPRICSCAGLCGLLCGWMVAPDDCCRFSDPPQPVVEDEILFCTLCKAEVRFCLETLKILNGLSNVLFDEGSVRSAQAFCLEKLIFYQVSIMVQGIEALTPWFVSMRLTFDIDEEMNLTGSQVQQALSKL